MYNNDERLFTIYIIHFGWGSILVNFVLFPYPRIQFTQTLNKVMYFNTRTTEHFDNLRTFAIMNENYSTFVVKTHFELFQSALNFETKSTHFLFCFQSAVIWVILPHFEKISSDFAWLSLFFLIKNFKDNYSLWNESISTNILSTILTIVRSFVRFLKLYCWDKSGLHHAN